MTTEEQQQQYHKVLPLSLSLSLSFFPVERRTHNICSSIIIVIVAVQRKIYMFSHSLSSFFSVGGFILIFPFFPKFDSHFDTLKEVDKE